MAELNIIDHLYGDKKYIWSKEDAEEAKRIFEEKIKEGWLAYRIDQEKPDRKGTQIKKFDEDAERIVLTPPPVRG